MLKRLSALLLIATLAACGGTGSAGAPNTGSGSGTVSGAGSLQYSASSMSVKQGVKSLSISVDRNGGSTGAVSVSYATTSGTAKAGVDYTATVGTLTWDDGDMSPKTITVPVSDSEPFVGTRSFTVTFTAISGGATMGSITDITVTLQGDAPTTAAGTVALSDDNYAVQQSAGSVTISVTRANGSSGAASVNYATADNTAVAGTDYTATSGTLNWADGDAATKTFSITVSNATLFVGTKSFMINLAAAAGAALAMPSAATVTVTGGGAAPTSGAISVQAAKYTVAQGAGPLTVTVVRTSGSQGAVSVQYATSDGTAVAGQDYTASSGTLNWADGDAAAKTVAIPISNSPTFSGSKAFAIALSNVDGGATLGTPNGASITINGSSQPGTLALVGASFSVQQNAGSFAIVVARSNGMSGAASINYATSDGTALGGTDYTAASGKLNWTDGDGSTKTIMISISNANPFSGTKSFNIALSGASGAAMGTPNRGPVTITGSTAVSTAGQMGETAAARLLNQATFGATLDSVASASSQSYDAWFTQQIAITPTYYLPQLDPNASDWTKLWWKGTLNAPDQLRQRAAFALSEIFVVSGSTQQLNGAPNCQAAYLDLLLKYGLGNFRTLLEQVTLSPNMGLWLSMFRNNKPNAVTGVHADENYAREIMQLFTVGLVKLNIDGSVQLDSTGTPVPTYAQADVLGIARVFTGWASNPVGGGGEGSWLYDLDQIHPMVAYQAHHDTDAKVIIGNTTVPAGGTAEADLKIALDTLFNHPNVGPFIGQQLIERLVTSNPSPAYITRVASVFNNNGQGVRGDMSAVFKAILTDPEAISTGGSTYGKLREPLLRVTGLWRAFNAYDSSKLYAESAIMLNSTHWFSQRVLYAPSVFNFFRPDYQRAGAMADAGMVVPEFQITNESTLIDTQNELSTLAYQYVDSQGNSHAGTQLDTSKFLNSSNVLLHVAQWESFAANPTTLVQKLNLVLMAGQMSTAMQNTLITYATQIPADTPWARVAETASLILSSPQYAVQR